MWIKILFYLIVKSCFHVFKSKVSNSSLKIKRSPYSLYSYSGSSIVGLVGWGKEGSLVVVVFVVFGVVVFVVVGPVDFGVVGTVATVAAGQGGKMSKLL